MSFENPTGCAWRKFVRIAAVTVVGVAIASPAQAVRFKLANGAIDGSFDTTVGWGLNMRTESEQNSSLASSVYGNRSIARYEVFNNTVKASHDLSLTGDKWGVFIRGNYFYDFDANHEDQTTRAASNIKEKHGDITDAYVYMRFGDDDQYNLRLGKQVISWGENTFIGNSINDINTVDVTKLRVPGVELKDAFIGTPAAYLSWQVNDAWTVEAFTLFTFDEIKVDPSGSYFTTLDPFGDDNPALGADGACLTAAPDGGSLGGGPLCAIGDKIPSGGGQYGLALRYYAADLGNGVDFGFYYQNLHDHVFKLGVVAGSGIASGSGRLYRWFPENIERWGMSWNTTVGSWAWGGEYGYRKNMKLQGDVPGAIGIAQGSGIDLLQLSGGVPTGVPIANGTLYDSEMVRNYGHHQLQSTFQRLWGPMPMFAGADQWNTIFEVVHGWVTGMPDNDEFDRFDESVTNNWQGFKGRSSLTYNNAIFNSINMTFNQVFNWDIRGYSSEFGGNKAFIEGRKTASLGLDFEYKLRYKWGVSHTWFWGGTPSVNDIHNPRGGPSTGLGNTPSNGLRDRDFLAFHASYTF